MLPLLLLGVGLITAASVGTAAADQKPFEIGKGGTNADGTCETFEGQPPQPGGTQTWQFNLTQSAAVATMSASFSDGTVVTDKPEDERDGKTAKWFIVTDAGAALTSATATFTPDGENSQFVVSHCTAGGEKPTPPTPPGPPGPPGGEGAAAAPGAEQAQAPAAVTAPARFTG
jgi:hypothetical protein